MTPEQHRRLGEIVHMAADLPEAQRQQYLQAACSADETLLAAARQVLSSNDDTAPVMHVSVEALDVVFQATPLPERIGPYRVIRKIGHGGMGAVYEAEQESPRRRVAIKMLRPGFAGPGLIRRFRREIELLGRLQHPGIAQVFGAGTTTTAAGEAPYFAMEYVQGLALSDYATQHHLSTRDRLLLVASIADAVQFAHQQGIIHRDLKPANILITEPSASATHHPPEASPSGPQPKILDFGIARTMDNELALTSMHTETGQIIGTLPYMSPEQIAGRPQDVDVRTDVYALGVIMYELLSGRLPHDVRERPLPEAVRIIAQDAPTRLGSIAPTLRGDVEIIVAKALEQEKQRRYASASELAADIRHFLNHEPIAARPATLIYQLRKFARRNRLFVFASSAAVVILIAGVIGTSIGLLRATRAGADSRRAQYRMSIAAAAAVAATDPVQARNHLEAAPLELRNWEWRYELARITPWAAMIETGLPEIGGSTVAFRAEGQPIAAVARSGGIAVIDLSSRQQLQEIRAESRVDHPALSADAGRLAAWNPTAQAVEVWDVAAGTRLAQLKHAGEQHIFGIAVSPSGLLVAASGASGATLWRVDTGETLFRTPSQLGPTKVLAIQPDDSRLFLSHSLPNSQNAFSAFDTTGRALQSIGLVEDCQALDISPDGKRLLMGTYNRIARIFDADTIHSEAVFRGHSALVFGVAYSPDGRWIATASGDGTCRVWDVTTQQCVAISAPGQIHKLAFSPSGKSLALSGPEQTLWWHWQAPHELVLSGHQSFVYFAAFSPDGNSIASYGWDHTVRLWDAADGKCLVTFPVGEAVFGLEFTPDGSRLVAQLPVSAALFDVHTLSKIEPVVLPADIELSRAIKGAENQPGGVAKAFLNHVRGGAKSTVVVEGGQRIASSLDRSRLVVSSPDGAVEIDDAATNRILLSFKPYSTWPSATALSPDGRILATSDKDGSIQLWNSRTGRPIATLSGHLSRVYSISFSPDGTRIVSGGNDNSIRLWDTTSFTQVAELHGHESYVHGVAFSPDGTKIVSCSGDGSIRIWDSQPPAASASKFRE